MQYLIIYLNDTYMKQKMMTLILCILKRYILYSTCVYPCIKQVINNTKVFNTIHPFDGIGRYRCVFEIFLTVHYTRRKVTPLWKQPKQWINSKVGEARFSENLIFIFNSYIEKNVRGFHFVQKGCQNENFSLGERVGFGGEIWSTGKPVGERVSISFLGFPCPEIYTFYTFEY